MKRKFILKLSVYIIYNILKLSVHVKVLNKNQRHHVELKTESMSSRARAISLGKERVEGRQMVWGDDRWKQAWLYLVSTDPSNKFKQVHPLHTS